MIYANNNRSGRKRRTTGAAREIHNAVVETLEARQLMSAVSVSDGVLRVQGNYTATNILSVRLENGGATAAVRVNGQLSRHALAGVNTVQLVGGNKNDMLYVDGAVKQKLAIQSKGGRDTIYAGSGDDRLGETGDTVRAAYKGTQVIAQMEGIQQGLRVSSFSLVNADTDRVITTFTGNNFTLNLGTLPTKNLNIRANVVNDLDGSVKFSYDRKLSVESGAPYALASDTNGNYWKWTPSLGTHTMVATPYAADGALGAAGVGKTVTFNVINAPAAAPAPTPTPVPTPTPAPVPDPIDSTDVDAPLPLIDVLDNSVQVGHAIHVHGLSSSIVSGHVTRTRFEWDFGDPTAKYNKLSGYNAAHVYAAPGTYTITLRVTNESGKTASTSTRVTVASSDRRVIYVSSTGSDSNSGLSQDSAIRTITRAKSLLTDDTEIWFRRGDTFAVTSAWSFTATNLVIGAYGTGERPTLKWTAGKSGVGFFQIGDGSKDVLVRDLSFTSTIPRGTKTGLTAVRVDGQNITVRGNEFLDIDEGVNGNGNPRGLLVQDNVNPDAKSMRGGLAWAQGSDLVFLGNVVKNSNHENVLRASAGATRLLIAHNDLANPDLGLAGDQKGAIVIQKTRYAYVTDNIVRDSWLSVGPLGKLDGLSDSGARTYDTVVENNRLYNSNVQVFHGSIQTAVRGNVINVNDRAAIWIDGYSSSYSRGVQDLYVYKNTAVNTGATGQFLRLGGSATGISLTHNLYVAPSLKLGSHGSAAVNVSTEGLSSFRLISGNVWSDALTRSGGAIIVGGLDTYISRATWEAYSQVHGDQFRDVSLGGTYQFTLGSVTAGSSLQRAA